MTHTEREWRDGQPEGTGLDESTGPGRAAPLAEQEHEDDPLVERVSEDDPLVERVSEDDPLVERAGQDDPLIERAGSDDALAEHVSEDDPLTERAGADDPLVEEVHHEEARPAEPAYDRPRSVANGAGAAQEPPAGLASAGDRERFVARWQEIQAGFVDEPRRAVQDADALVVDMMDRLARMLASERDQLESAGQTGKVSTEDLRLGL
ncbi:MAG TPA: hypothetical protein VLL69_06445, partial [Streptosporangiaceae bacterium]|nr:hypothetical protein [Streptosporangiaceae bacterium]